MVVANHWFGHTCKSTIGLGIFQPYIVHLYNSNEWCEQTVARITDSFVHLVGVDASAHPFVCFPIAIMMESVICFLVFTSFDYKSDGTANVFLLSVYSTTMLS